jgi:hypothetical protein
MGVQASPQAAAGLPDPAAVAPVAVAEVSAERLVGDPPEIPWHITPQAGAVALQLRTTVRRVAVGAGLARDSKLMAQVAAIEGVPAVVTSPAGGTFIIGGPAWLGLCAIGVPLPGQPLPLDWMLRSLHRWFDAALAPLHVITTVGRVQGAWCPGFSDIAAGGRKLAGLGFRVTREWVVMRGVMAVQPLDAADLAVLVACHRLIGVEVRGEASTSLAQASGRSSLDVAGAIETMRSAVT